MYPYITCYCGRSLGDLYDLFKEMRLKKYINFMKEHPELNIDPYMIPYCDDISIPLRDVFEALNINLQCCRARMLTQVEYKELY